METNERNEMEVEVMDAEIIEEPEEDEIEESSSGGGICAFAMGFAAGVGVTKAVGWAWGKIKGVGTKTRKRVVAKVLEKEGIEVPEDYLEVPAEETEKKPESDEETKKKSKKK